MNKRGEFMYYVYIVTFIFIVIAAIQVPLLIKQKLYKELAVFSVLMLLALIYSYDDILNWNLPAPTGFITKIFSPISQLILGEQYKF